MKQIYSKLLSGIKLTVSFPNKKELAAFKSQLYTMHNREIAAFTKIGMECDFADRKFVFTKVNGSDVYKVMLVKEKELPQRESKREFKILSDEEVAQLKSKEN